MEEANIQLQEEAKNYVKATVPWLQFFYILFFICIGFMAVGAIFMFAMIPLMNHFGTDLDGMPVFIFGVCGALYLIVAALYVPLSIYLMRATKDARNAVAQNSNEAAVRYMLNTKKYWKFYGIITIALVGLSFVLGIVLGIVSVSMAM